MENENLSLCLQEIFIRPCPGLDLPSFIDPTGV
jgi:hypothetical protein